MQREIVGSQFTKFTRLVTVDTGGDDEILAVTLYNIASRKSDCLEALFNDGWVM